MSRRSSLIHPKHFKKLRPFRAEDLPDPLFAAPPEATDLFLVCPLGHRFRPPWGKKLPHEYSSFSDAVGTIFAPTAVSVPCDTCGENTLLEFPKSPVGGGYITLFGDESYHWSTVGGRLTYIYAFVGAIPEGYRTLDGALKNFKEIVRPNCDPSNWVLHTADLRNSRWREKNGVTIGIDAINEEMRRLASLLGQNDRDIFLYVGSTIKADSPIMGGKNAKLGFIRDRLLTASLVALTSHLTSQGASPSFVLEQVGNAAAPDFIDAYVERIGRGLFHSLTFLYSARGQFVGLPTTAPKSTCVEIQFADFVAYWANRSFHRQSLDRQSEVPMELFGSVAWGASSGNRFGLFSRVGFPWDVFPHDHS